MRKPSITPTTTRLRPHCLAILFLCLALTTPAHAHNSAVATAAPIAHITVDGDFSDWPPDIERYPIALPEFGDAPRDAEDLRAFFRVGYNADEQALYLAVEAEDESVMPDSMGSGYRNDGCEVYLSLDSKPPVQYGIWNDYQEAIGLPAHQSGYALSFKRSQRTHRYEWRFDLQTIARQGIDGKAIAVVGLDVVVTDHDGDDSYSWVAWGKSPFKMGRVDRLGDLWLQERDEKAGQLRGQLLWEGTEKGIARHALVVKGEEHEWLAQTDRSGRFVLDLSPGRYEIAAADSMHPVKTKTVEVRAGEVANIVVARAHGPGKPIGVRRSGYWQTLGVLDGLSVAPVNSIVQDADGSMWFGSRGGLSNYNGRDFTNYTMGDTLSIGKMIFDADGDLWFLAYNRQNKPSVVRYDGEAFKLLPMSTGVRTLLVDRRDNIWLATEDKGALRYDGSGFTSFSAELPSNQVYDLAKDRQGNLWFATRGGVVRYDGSKFTVPEKLEGLVEVRRILDATTNPPPDPRSNCPAISKTIKCRNQYEIPRLLL